MTVLSGAQQFMQWLQGCGYFILVLSARPSTTYKRLFSDTLSWLRNNGMPFNALVFTEEKHEYLHHLMTYERKRIDFAVEDELGQARNIAELGIKVYLLNRPYNDAPTIHGVIRVDRLQEIAEIYEGIGRPRG